MLAMKFEGGGIVCLAVCSVSFCSGSLSWSSQLFAPGLPSIYFILASLKSTEVRSPCSLQVVGEIFHPYNLSGRHDLADLGVSFGTVGELGLSPHPLLLIPPTRTRTSSKSSLPATLQPTLLPPPQPPPASPPPRLPISSRTSRPSRILSSCSHHLHLLPMTMSVSTGFTWCFSISLLSPYVDSRPGVTVVSSLPILSRSWDHSPPSPPALHHRYTTWRIWGGWKMPSVLTGS